MASVTRAASSTTHTATHTYSREETEAYCQHINEALGGHPKLGEVLPLNLNNMFQKLADGKVLCLLINYAIPDSIDERAINFKAKMSQFEQIENLNLAVNSAKAIGCSVVNVGAQDILELREHIILGLIWQVIRIGLLSNVTLTAHPELYRLLEEGETMQDLMKLPAEKVLLRWFNYHLAKAGTDRRVKNFAGDIKDSECYTLLLNQLSPSHCDKAALKETDPTKRAEHVIANAKKIDCDKFVKARDIVAGNPKLNLAFVANLFNTLPGLEALTEEEKAGLDAALFNAQGTREERAFQLWINSLGVDPFVHNLYDDLQNGLVLLSVIDKIEPGRVDWKRVNKNVPMMRVKAVENTNYVVDLGKDMKFSLVGVGGVDITDGKESLTLAVVWQLMRHHVLTVLKEVGGGAPVSEQAMIKWANETVAASGKASTMKNFKDQSLRDSVFFLELLDAIRNVVDWSLVTRGNSEADLLNNAKYAISIARKLGATIFVLPEDITESKDKMILTFIGSIMAVGKKSGK